MVNHSFNRLGSLGLENCGLATLGPVEMWYCKIALTLQTYGQCFALPK